MKFKFKRRKRVIQQQRTLKERHCFCFLGLASDPKDPKHEIITIEEGESEGHEIIAIQMYNYLKNNGKSVTYKNDRDQDNRIHEEYDGKTGKTKKILTKLYVPVDKDALIATIEEVGKEYEGGVLPEKYFPTILKLLQEGFLGTGHKTTDSRKFKKDIVKDFETPKDASFSKYKPKGVYSN